MSGVSPATSFPPWSENYVTGKQLYSEDLPSSEPSSWLALTSFASLLLNSGTSLAWPEWALFLLGVCMCVCLSVFLSQSLAQSPFNQFNWNSAHKSTLESIWESNSKKKQLQLLIANTSCWQLMKMKINLESWYLANISCLGFVQKLHSISSHINCYQSAVAKPRLISASIQLSLVGYIITVK